MKIKIVTINTTHSCDDKVEMCNSSEEWIRVIQEHAESQTPIYIFPHVGTGYVYDRFIRQVLTPDGYVKPGDYATYTPEFGLVEYSVWTEKSDYWASLGLIDNKPQKTTFWSRHKSLIKALSLALLVVVGCSLANAILHHIGVGGSLPHCFVIGYLFGEIHSKNRKIKYNNTTWNM